MKIMLRSCLRGAGAVIGLLAAAAAVAVDDPVHFGVINQRSVSLTAQYWNPILEYVSRRSGVPLRLRMGRSAPETTAMTVRGEFGFVLTNHLFTPQREKLGYRVIARLGTPGIRAVIIVPQVSAIKSLAELSGQRVVFPSREAFVGYWVPMDHLLKRGVRVQEAFAGNQEGAMAQLKAGKAAAAAVNLEVLEAYAQREGLRYRTLWASESYLDLPVMASPAVPADRVRAVEQALIGMQHDPEGRRILEASAAVIGAAKPAALVAATDRDYANYRHFYRHTMLKAGGE